MMQDSPKNSNRTFSDTRMFYLRTNNCQADLVSWRQIMAKVSLNLIGHRVKCARQAAEPPLTQQELSEKLGNLGVFIDRAGIAKIETGIRRALDYEVVAVANALSVKVTWLLGVKE
jgi:hypothetical protein